MRIRKESIKGDSASVQNLIEALAENISFAQWPGEIELGGTVEEMLKGFLNTACSIDYPDFNNSLKIFNRISTVRRLFDSLSSIELSWLVNNTLIDKSDSWAVRVNEQLAKPKTFAEVLPITLRFNALKYTIIEYNGSIRIGGNYRKEKQNFGISMKLEMKLKYANAEDFHTELDPHTTNRYQDLDLDSRKLEYTRIKHTPFTSLYCLGKELPLFSKTSSFIKPNRLATLALVAEIGDLLTPPDSIKGSSKQTTQYFTENKLYTVVEIEGMKVWDGKKGIPVEQPKLLGTLMDEATAIPMADSFAYVECDIQVFVYNSEDKMLFKQLAKLNIAKIKNDFCGTVVDEKSIVKKEEPSKIELERIERDNIKLKEIQDLFDSSIHRSTDISTRTQDVDIQVMSFLKEIPHVAVPEENYKDFDFLMSLDGEDLYLDNMDSLSKLHSWGEFKKDLSDYDYSSKDEFVFDLTLSASIEGNKKDAVLDYKGTLNIVPINKSKLSLSVSLAANKLASSASRDYFKKSPVNRFATLDID